MNLSKLTYLYSDGNKILAEKEQDIIPKFQLKFLYLDGNGYVGEFPKFLKHQHELEEVYLSNTILGERFPYWLLDNNTNLHTLHLSNNSLLGPLELPIHPYWNLSSLDVSENSFHGNIPTQIGTYFPKLTYLDMSTCGFDGIIPSSLGNMSSLQRLRLGGNLLTGSIGVLSTCISLTFLDMSRNNLSEQISDWVGNMPSLLFLDLSENNIPGIIPSKFGLSNVVELHLARNNLQGSLDDAFFHHSKMLMILDLSHNHLVGSIPSWIGEFPHLGNLHLSYNKFEGRLPMELCKLTQLSFIDLSHNSLSGDILSCIRCESNPHRMFQLGDYTYGYFMKGHIELIMKGKEYRYEGMNSNYMVGLDFSANNFTGNIPLEFGKLGEMKLLNLSNNNLIGIIPATFSNLSQIESLDLSRNNLQGSIPIGLVKSNFLQVFNVSYNNLSGMIPEGPQFATFDESSYLGNPFLYGCPLPRNCSLKSTHLPNLTPSIHNSEVEHFIDMESFYVSFGVAYVMVLLGIIAVLFINPEWRRAWCNYAQVSMENCYYFIIDNIVGPLSKFWR